MIPCPLVIHHVLPRFVEERQISFISGYIEAQVAFVNHAAEKPQFKWVREDTAGMRHSELV